MKRKKAGEFIVKNADGSVNAEATMAKVEFVIAEAEQLLAMIKPTKRKRSRKPPQGATYFNVAYLDSEGNRQNEAAYFAATDIGIFALTKAIQGWASRVRTRRRYQRRAYCDLLISVCRS